MNEALTRRAAVRATAAGVALAATPGILVGRTPDPVRWGMIGTGSRGSYLLRRLRGVPGGTCVALCDTNPVNLKNGADTIGGSPRLTGDARVLFDDPQVEAVFVVTPLYLHFPFLRDGLLAGKHVFCEKSMVFRPHEVHATRALAAAHPRQVLQVGLQRRYSEYYRAVKALIDKGDLGQVTHIQAQWHRNGLSSTWVNRPGNWRVWRKYSGGIAAELASHQIDVADWMFGAHPEAVMGMGDNSWHQDGRDIHDNIQLIFRYPGGRKLTYSSITTNSHLAAFNSQRTEVGEIIMGTGGTVEITVGDGKQPAIALQYAEPSPQKASGPKPEKFVAGATMVTLSAERGTPVCCRRTRWTGSATRS